MGPTVHGKFGQSRRGYGDRSRLQGKTARVIVLSSCKDLSTFYDLFTMHKIPSSTVNSEVEKIAGKVAISLKSNPLINGLIDILRTYHILFNSQHMCDNVRECIILDLAAFSLNMTQMQKYTSTVL